MSKVEPINAYEALNEIIEAQRQTIQSLTAVIVELEKLHTTQVKPKITFNGLSGDEWR